MSDHGSQRGAFHIVGIVIVLLVLGALYLLSSWSRDVRELRSEVAGLDAKVHRLEGQVAEIKGRIGP